LWQLSLGWKNEFPLPVQTQVWKNIGGAQRGRERERERERDGVNIDLG